MSHSDFKKIISIEKIISFSYIKMNHKLLQCSSGPWFDIHDLPKFEEVQLNL